MDIWQAIILGLVQGLTEFLPVSSSGHLTLVQRLLGVDGDVVAFDVLVHVATLAAVVVVLWREVVDIIRHPIAKGMILVVATLPTVAIVVLFRDFFESTFDGSYLGFGFLLSAVLIFVQGKIISQNKLQAEISSDENSSYNKEWKNVSSGSLMRARNSHALAMGLAQGLAVLPGLSRSGTTMFAGMLSGLSREAAVRFSFLMSIPIIIASALLKLPDLNNSAPTPLLAGFFAAFVSALVSVRVMLRLVRNNRLLGFAVYLSALGVFLLLNEYLLFIF